MLLTYGLYALIFVIVYLICKRSEYLGNLVSFVFTLIGKPINRLEILLLPFHNTATKHPGLRPAILIVSLVLAVAALSSEIYQTMVSISALFGDASITLPPLPTFFTYSSGWLFISISALFGSLYLEQTDVVPTEAKIFTVPVNSERSFKRIIGLSFLLSIVLSAAFYMLKIYFLADPTSNTVHLLQLLVFVLLGLLVPLTGAISLYVVTVGLLALLSLPLTVIWFIASILADLCEYLAAHFEQTPKRNDPPPSSLFFTPVYPTNTPPALPSYAQPAKLIGEHKEQDQQAAPVLTDTSQIISFEYIPTENGATPVEDVKKK